MKNSPYVYSNKKGLVQVGRILSAKLKTDIPCIAYFKCHLEEKAVIVGSIFYYSTAY